MMDQLQLKLTKITMIALAKAVWDSEETKNRIRDKVIKNSMNRWNEDVMPHVLSSITQKLPKKLKTELEEVVVFVGEEICSWIKFLIETRRLDYKFAETTYLTPFGTIDESQIMEKYWLENRKVLGDGFLDLVCMFCQEKIIFESRYEITKKLATTENFEKKITTELNQLRDEDELVQFILTNWLNVQYECEDPKAYAEMGVEIGPLPVPAKKIRNASFEFRKSVLLMSFSLGYSHLFKYFWKKWRGAIDVDVICDSLIESCEKNFRGDLKDYEKRKHFEIILILTKAEIIENNYEIFLEMAFRCWPYQELFLKIFYAVKSKINSVREWIWIFEMMGKKALEDFYKKCPIKKTTHRAILKEVLAQTHPDLKDNSYIISCLAQVYTTTLNIPTLKMILNYSPKLYPETISRTIYEWIEKDEFFFLEEFLGEFDDERGFLKYEIKTQVIFQLLSRQNFAALDKLFPLLDKYNMKITKSDIDGIEFIKYKYNYRFDLAEGFVKWFYDDEDSEVKNYFKSEEISKNYIFSLFCRETDFLQEKAGNFLNFIFDSEEEIMHFKQHVLLDDENSIVEFDLGRRNDKYIRIGVGHQPSSFPLEKLVEFCELPEEKVKQLRFKCVKVLEKQIIGKGNSTLMCVLP